MSERNPWVAAAKRVSSERATEDQTQAAPLDDGKRPSGEIAGAQAVAPPVTGAAAPQGSVSPPGPDEGGLPVRMVRPTASLWVVGAHGGAGESVLSDLEAEWEAGGHAWPTPSDLSVTCSCVLVARTHAAGLRAAQVALRQWASGAVGPSTRLLGLILVADAPGRLPKPLRELSALVAGGAPRTWRVGWVEAWRTGETLAGPDLPKPLRQLIADLSMLSDSSETEEPTTAKK